MVKGVEAIGVITESGTADKEDRHYSAVNHGGYALAAANNGSREWGPAFCTLARTPEGPPTATTAIKQVEKSDDPGRR
jgi:hypothetical protein